MPHMCSQWSWTGDPYPGEYFCARSTNDTLSGEASIAQYSADTRIDVPKHLGCLLLQIHIGSLPLQPNAASVKCLLDQSIWNENETLVS